MTEGRTCTVARVEPVAKDQSLLTLEPDPVLAVAHTRAGQFCQLLLPDLGLDGFFTMVDPPASGLLRFLVRAGTPMAEQLRNAEPGSKVQVVGPMGDGFPIELAQGRDVLLVSAGAGIAALRPLVLLFTPVQGRTVWLYHGTRTLEYLPFFHDLEAAQKNGLKLTVTVSQAPSQDLLRERVQNALSRDKPPLSNAVAFVSGMPALLDGLKVLLPTLGLPVERIYVNF